MKRDIDTLASQLEMLMALRYDEWFDAGLTTLQMVRFIDGCLRYTDISEADDLLTTLVGMNQSNELIHIMDDTSGSYHEVLYRVLEYGPVLAQSILNSGKWTKERKRKLAIGEFKKHGELAPNDIQYLLDFIIWVGIKQTFPKDYPIQKNRKIDRFVREKLCIEYYGNIEHPLASAKAKAVRNLVITRIDEYTRVVRFNLITGSMELSWRMAPPIHHDVDMAQRISQRLWTRLLVKKNPLFSKIRIKNPYWQTAVKVARHFIDPTETKRTQHAANRQIY
jgi:hypothetical protein